MEKIYWVTSEINEVQKSQSTGNMKETVIYRNINEEKTFVYMRANKMTAL